MKRGLAVVGVLICGACSSAGSDTGRIATILYDYVRGDVPKITRDQAAAVPYASMGMSLGSSAEGLLVLGALTPDEAEWYAGDRVFVATTRQGQIVRTVGLPYDLGGLRAEIPSAIANAQGGAASPSSRILFDFPDLGVFDATAQCVRRDAGPDTVDILGTSLSTRHIVQHCDVPALKWSFDNDFWEDLDSGFVWRSRQHIHPKLPAVNLEVLRPVQEGTG